MGAYKILLTRRLIRIAPLAASSLPEKLLAFNHWWLLSKLSF